MTMIQSHCCTTVTLVLLIITLATCVNAHPGSYKPVDNMEWCSTLSGMGEQFADMLTFGSFAQIDGPSSQVGAGTPPPQHNSEPQPQRSSASDTDFFMLAPMSPADDLMSRSAPSPYISSPVFEANSRPATFRGRSFASSFEVPYFGVFERQHVDEDAQTFQYHSNPGIGQAGPTSHPRGYCEPLRSTDVTPFLDKGLFEMEMPTHDFSLQQQYPEMNQYDLSRSASGLQEVQQSAMLQMPMSEVCALDEAYISPPFVPENEADWSKHNSPPAVASMRGWVGRAPTFGENLLPRLDTTHLVPPASCRALSPSSASSAASSSSRLSFSRRPRNQAIAGDFICHWCGAAYSTSVDLTHHLRSHAPYASRNHVCQQCEKRFQYRKDLLRHLPRHDPNRQKFYCPFKGCKYHGKGFGRRDHLDRHVLSQHPRIDTPLEDE